MGWLVKRELVPAQVRRPSAATVPGNQWFHSGPMSQSWLAGWSDKQIEQLYTNVYLFACAKARALDLASLPIRVGADPDKPKDFDRQHPIAKLLGPAPGGPTTMVSSRRMVSWSLMQYDVMGRMAWEVSSPSNGRRDNVPFELWPVPVSRVRAVPTTEGGQWFSHYEISSQNGPIRKSLGQMVYHWRPTQNDFREPESLLAAAGINIAIATMQDRYDHAFLVNDARPSFVVVHEAFDRKKERNSFRRQFLDRHQGVDNAGKVAFVEASRDGAMPSDSLLVHQLGLSQKDAEFIERYENQIRAICVAMGVPLSRLADSSRRTYSNAEIETVNYWRNAVQEAGVEFAEAINTSLMPLVGDTSNVAWFDTTAVPELQPAPRFAIGDIPALLKSKAISVNESRVRMDLQERDGFDDLGLPEGAEADGDPIGNGRAAHALDSLSTRVVSKLEAFRHQQTRAVLSRAQGKRGRQASGNGGSMATLYDPVYWYDQAEEFFRDIATEVLHIAYATGQTPMELNSSAANEWVRCWSGVLATRWVDSMTQQMGRQSIMAESIAVETPGDLFDIVPDMWRLVQTGEVVPADQVAVLATRLAAGTTSLESAIASLGA
jgi:hypothetical protein